MSDGFCVSAAIHVNQTAVCVTEAEAKTQGIDTSKILTDTDGDCRNTTNGAYDFHSCFDSACPTKLVKEKSDSCTTAVMHQISVNGDLPEPKECVQKALKMPELAKICDAYTLRAACRGEGHPNLFGCSDVTAAVCATCFNHKEAFKNVCVW